MCVDGWHKVEASEGMTIKNQVVGFFIAVQYLRGALAFCCSNVMLVDLVVWGYQLTNCLAYDMVSLCLCESVVPLILVNALMILLELIMG